METIPKTRYWDFYRRTESERQREKDHVTRFGPHWVVEYAKRPIGARAYSTDSSPYEPRKGYAGVWRGRTTTAGKAAPNKWAAQGRGPLPYGIGPTQVMMVRKRWSMDATNDLRLSDSPNASQRIRDLMAHLAEQARKEKHPYLQEMASVEFQLTDQLRWLLDSGRDDDKTNIEPRGPCDTYVAASNGMGLENITRTIEERRAKYGKVPRERQKAGRKPIGPVAMSAAERMRKHRRNKALKRSPPTSVPTAGVDQPMPLGSTMPAELSTPMPEEARRHELA